VGNTLQRDLQSVQYSSIEKDATFGKETVLLCSTTCSCDTTTTKDTNYETTPSPPRRSRSPARDGPQTEALIARISELTSVVSPLVAERDQGRASASSSYRRRRSRSDSWDSRRRGRSRSPRESRYEP